MSQNSTIPNSNYHSMVVLGDAAWTLLANQPIDQIDIDVVADMAGIDRGLAGALAGSVQCLVLAKMSELDRQSLTETYGEIQDAGEICIRENNRRALHWFENLCPYRSQIEQLNRSARSHPDLALRLPRSGDTSDSCHVG